jgi:hypothetical protein
VQPACTGWGTVLTSAVETALGGLIESTQKQLAQWIIEAAAL